MGNFDAKFQVETVAPIHYKNVSTSFFCFVTMHAFERWTDGRTFRSWLRPPCIQCSAVKTINKYFIYFNNTMTITNHEKRAFRQVTHPSNDPSSSEEMASNQQAQ